MFDMLKYLFFRLKDDFKAWRKGWKPTVGKMSMVRGRIYEDMNPKENNKPTPIRMSAQPEVKLDIKVMRADGRVEHYNADGSFRQLKEIK